MIKQIAFFDFDGTITTKDTLLEFIKYSKGKCAFYRGFLLNAHYLVAYKLGLVSNQAAKEKILEYFFKGFSLSDFDNHCREFAMNVLPKFIRPGAVAEIQKLKSVGTKIVIVTASAENWVKFWAESLDAELLGTRLGLQADKITGKIQDINCHGEEKVRRIKDKYSLKDYEKIFAYGDTIGDKAMLKLADESFYKPFR